MTVAVLDVKNLEKSFGLRKAVDGVSFSVGKGEIFGLLGPNGAGKSTTLSLICGLLKPGKGSIRVRQWDMSAQSLRAKALIGVVPQEPALYPQLSAKANLKFWGELHGLSGAPLNEAVEKTLRLVGLEDRANDRIGKYSGGMKRRLNIAAGMVHSPQLIIMDEPTVGVDPQSRRHILDTVKNLKNEGTTIIYTSHYVEEVEELCDRVAIMDHGKVLSTGPITELLNQAGQYQELSIHLFSSGESAVPHIRALPGIHDAVATGQSLKVLSNSAEQTLPLVWEELTRQKLQVSEIKISRPNLESLFLKLTGRALRDN